MSCCKRRHSQRRCTGLGLRGKVGPLGRSWLEGGRAQRGGGCVHPGPVERWDILEGCEREYKMGKLCPHFHWEQKNNDSQYMMEEEELLREILDNAAEEGRPDDESIEIDSGDEFQP
ncbi:hypothetical protein C8F04DRAFT_1200328 [Mycena alexandri]|uniref:Uncharacterized protein n=1 Tax=Mycena alexandri TaxID=1745969 RepID=A0AAD6RXZ8_9AGAR|nr:hypothetical protein C8F04DRAFT_1200328 [Mycena alexandri]